MFWTHSNVGIEPRDWPLPYSRVNHRGHMSDRADVEGLLRMLAVAEAGSFAEAARRLGISRQAVHRSVDTLEQAAGGALFDRGQGGLRPTSLGRTLLVHAAELRRVERAFHAALEHAYEPSGSLRVTAPPLFADAVLAIAVARFCEAWPAVGVVLRVDSGRTDLVRDDFDLMLRVGAKPPEAHYALNVGTARLCLCASPSYVARTGALDSPDELIDRPLLQFGPKVLPSWTFTRGEDRRAVTPSPVLLSDSAPVVVGACVAGLGVLLAPELAVAASLGSGLLVRVLPDWTLPSPHVWAIYGHRTRDDATLRAFVEVLRDALVVTGS